MRSPARGAAIGLATTPLAAIAQVVFAQPAASGGGGGGGGGRWGDAAPSAAPGTPSWIWLLLGVVLVAIVVALVMRVRSRASASAAPAAALGTSTFALRAVAGILTWLGGAAAALGLLGAAAIFTFGAAADRGLLGLLGGVVPAIGGVVTGLVIMVLGQLLGCIAAIEAHTRVIAKHASENAEETARLRAVVMGRLPAPERTTADANDASPPAASPEPAKEAGA